MAPELRSARASCAAAERAGWQTIRKFRSGWAQCCRVPGYPEGRGMPCPCQWAGGACSFICVVPPMSCTSSVMAPASYSATRYEKRAQRASITLRSESALAAWGIDANAQWLDAAF